MSVVGGEASLDWLDLRRPEFDGSGLREDGDHDGYPFSVLLDSQDFALPASVRATDDSNLIARLHTHWHHLKEDSPLAYFSRVASALASDRANATYQPRRALRAVGCMRLFGVRLGSTARFISSSESFRPPQTQPKRFSIVSVRKSCRQSSFAGSVSRRRHHGFAKTSASVAFTSFVTF